MGRSRQRCSISQQAGISPSYLRTPSSGAGTNLGASGRTVENVRTVSTLGPRPVARVDAKRRPIRPPLRSFLVLFF